MKKLPSKLKEPAEIVFFYYLYLMMANLFIKQIHTRRRKRF